MITAVFVLTLTAVSGDDHNRDCVKNNASEIEGSWLITVTPAGGAPAFKALLTYAAGGGLTGVDASLPPSQVTALHGTWVRKGGHKFAFTFVEFLFDPAGAFIGSIKIHENLTFEAHGDTYNGVWTGEVLDPDGNLIAPIGGTTHATRINAE
jgi:hypothetical protein